MPNLLYDLFFGGLAQEHAGAAISSREDRRLDRREEERLAEADRRKAILEAAQLKRTRALTDATNTRLDVEAENRRRAANLASLYDAPQMLRRPDFDAHTRDRALQELARQGKAGALVRELASKEPPPTEPVVEVFDPRSPTGTQYVPRSAAAGRFGKPSVVPASEARQRGELLKDEIFNAIATNTSLRDVKESDLEIALPALTDIVAEEVSALMKRGVPKREAIEIATEAVLTEYAKIDKKFIGSDRLTVGRQPQPDAPAAAPPPSAEDLRGLSDEDLLRLLQ